jgi:hypothetical protein
MVQRKQAPVIVKINLRHAQKSDRDINNFGFMIVSFGQFIVKKLK